MFAGEPQGMGARPVAGILPLPGTAQYERRPRKFRNCAGLHQCAGGACPRPGARPVLHLHHLDPGRAGADQFRLLGGLWHQARLRYRQWPRLRARSFRKRAGIPAGFRPRNRNPLGQRCRHRHPSRQWRARQFQRCTGDERAGGEPHFQDSSAGRHREHGQRHQDRIPARSDFRSLRRAGDRQ